jgi:dTDP-4-dehydrorhamnose 3,5-epimerase
MKVSETRLPGVLTIDPTVFSDARGLFLETYHAARYAERGIDVRFVQDNVSVSRQGVLRGLHFQEPHGQVKLVTVLLGEVFDVAVDVRRGSPTFGQWIGFTLSEANRRQVLVPAGFAHGFLTLSPTAVFSYKCSDIYLPDCERSLSWRDPQVAIEWPSQSPQLSAKDADAPLLEAIPPAWLPCYTRDER